MCKEKHQNLLTEMRFRNIMWDSGTPFWMSNSIAWLAELPAAELLILIMYSSSVRKTD